MGNRVISKSSHDLVATKERALIDANICVNATNRSSQSAAAEPACLIVGAAKPDEDASGKKYNTVCLVQWAGFAAKECEYSWLNDSDLGSCYDS